MVACGRSGRDPAVWIWISRSIIVLWEKEDDVVCGSVLKESKLAHVDVFMKYDRVVATMELDLEPARLSIEAAIRYEEKALVCQFCTFNIERGLINGPEITIVLIVVVLKKNRSIQVRQ